MKKKMIKMISLLLVALLSASCSTAYDSYGRPTQSVDPALATAGIAAAGLIGYSLSKNRYKDDHKYRGHHRSSNRHYYRDHGRGHYRGHYRHH